MFFTIKFESGMIKVLDQRLLPAEESYLQLKTVDDVCQAIKNLVIRGAPAIGIAAAMGIALGMASLPENLSLPEKIDYFQKFKRELAATRPTAVNLIWALKRMEKVFHNNLNMPHLRLIELLNCEANKILEEDITTNKKIGNYGQQLLPAQANIITHCNAGALATGGFGTALGVVRAALENGKKIHVFAGETRPYLQGARLTCWELMQDNIPVTLITDNMAGFLMSKKKIAAIIVGADRIALNGDTANKIGTYSLAILANFHQIPFYVAAPISTIDFSINDGSAIPIEERSAEEILYYRQEQIGPQQCPVWHPAFDITPANLITAIITEKGIIARPDRDQIRRLFEE